ncbi:MAG: hypothetical protein IPP69_14785 [Flavobacteriales bacterium]|nr:hypothetical protein [Flavobacteriales bacterium]
MGLVTLISNYAEFNAWANNKVTHRLSQLDSQLLYQKTFSSFPSIDLTLQHMLRTQKFWHLFIQRQDISAFDWSVFENKAEQIMSELNTQSEAMKMTFSAYDENDLTEKLQLNMPWAKNECSRYEYILHVVNHSTFHRGQIITMLRSLGIEKNIPATDYNMFHCRTA